nr:uncharacterized protein LOC117274412 [Nicotiana tomentosiformis]
MGWYHSVTRLFVGNPIHCAGGRYIPYAGRHEALAIGLHLFHQLGLQMQQHASEGAATLHDYGQQVTELAARTLRRAREDERLGHDPAYAAPEQYHQGRAVPRGRVVPRGMTIPRGRAVPRGRAIHRVVGAGEEVVPSKGALRHLLRMLELISRVTAGPTTLSTELASTTDDHAAVHPAIKK